MAITDIVTNLAKDADAKAFCPFGRLVDIAVDRIASGAELPRGARRKLSAEQALAAMIACTRMVRRHHLTPSTVCADAGLIEEASGTFRYMLTLKEMDHAGELIGTVNPRSDIAKGLRKYSQIVQEIAQAVGVDKLPLLDELGSAIADYLTPFEDHPEIGHEAIADDFSFLGSHFSRTPKGSDGQPIDLSGFFRDSYKLDLVYDPDADAMIQRPDDPWATSSHGPSIRLFMRQVAHGQGHLVHSTRKSSGPGYDQEDLGAAHYEVHEIVSVALVLKGNAVRAVLVADPWTACVELGKVARGWGFRLQDRSWTQGTPFSGGITINDTGRSLRLVQGDGLVVRCPLYQEHLDNCLVTTGGCGLVYGDESVCMPRTIDIEPDVLRTFLDDKAADALRSMLAIQIREDAYSWAEGYAVPMELQLPDGRTVDGLMERLENVLHDPNGRIMQSLLDQATKRVRALEAVIASNSSSTQQRRTAFRRRMRS